LNQPLNLSSEKLVSKFASKFNLYHYAVVLTQVPISGGRERATPVETLMQAWNAAAAAAAAAADEAAPAGTTAVSAVSELGDAISHAAAAVGGGGGGGGAGVVCVTGSLNTVSRAQAWAVERGYRR
jgi:hypothetical protein